MITIRAETAEDIPALRRVNARLGTFVAIVVMTLASNLISRPVFGQQGTQTARKIDEYSKCKQGIHGCVNMEDEWARVDSLATELRANPDLQGYIVGYKALRDFPGGSLRHINYIRELVRSRVVDDSRVRVIDGGYRRNLTIELWVSSNCSSTPIPGQTVGVEATDGKSAYKFDEFRPPIRKELEDVPFPEDESVSYSPPVLMDGFAAWLEREPLTRGYIIAYDGQNDRAGTAYKFAESYRAYIYNSSSIGHNPNVDTSGPSRVVTVKGGRRKARAIELWIIPPGAPAPEPQPKPQRRRGKNG